MKILSTAFLALLIALSTLAGQKEKEYYDETYRPQFHFSPEANWQSNPNGLVFYKGEYHMFYQTNPKGNEKGFAHWGHATSTDLLHWKHQPVAISPDENSEDADHCTILSGSAIVDHKNVLNKQNGDEKTLVAFYTSQSCGQRIAYSTDKGNTWQKLENNPIIPFDESDDACDPKVFWHADSEKYVMVLFRKLSENRNTKGVSIYTSSNLLDWEWKSHIPGFLQCPDLVELKVSNLPNEKKWVMFDADGSYLVGNFDGENFTAETGKMKSDYGKNYFATQTWSNVSDDRTLQIAWMRGGKFPDMPFNGQMSFPCEISLKKLPSGYRVIRKPAREIAELHDKTTTWESKNVIPGINDNKLKKVSGDCLHLVGEFDLKTSDNFGIMLRHSTKQAGTEILYNSKRGLLTVLGCNVPVKIKNNKIKLEILLDRTSIEVFVNDGEQVVSNCFTPHEKANKLVLFTNGGELGIDKMEVHKLNNVWREK